MAKIILSANPAQRDGNFISTTFFLNREGEGFPRREVEIKKADEALTALDSYAKEIEATGKGASINVYLGRGERAPRGFRKLDDARKLSRFVNLD